MAKRFIVHSNCTLYHRSGAIAANGGESVSATHSAVLALEDPSTVGRFADEEATELDADGLPVAFAPIPDPAPPAAPSATRQTLPAPETDAVVVNHGDEGGIVTDEDSSSD